MITIEPKDALETAIRDVKLPKTDSHKGQNGRLLIISGSSLFHAPAIWSAQIASHFVDLVHFCPSDENIAVVNKLKSSFTNGIVISQKDMPDYANEDDCILFGPGMMRSESKNNVIDLNWDQILKLADPGLYAKALTFYLLKNYPDKKMVVDAGGLQMLDPDWLLLNKQQPIITPQTVEFKRIFGVDLSNADDNVRKTTVKLKAQKYHCIIVLKAVKDYISDGTHTVVISGGNQGLTKGGTGDILASLIASFYCKSPSLTSCIIASSILKSTADQLAKKNGIFYNIENIINKIPEVAYLLLKK